ncbi:MAG TPA: dihydroorotase family protein [Candidatus Eisenbacteria bacterium]|nr:dihydroorotase family protein [Candidatus Eisenbacteria bacterium]
MDPIARPQPPPHDLVVRGGTVRTPGGLREADVAVAGERIAAVEPGVAPGRDEVDARGLLVLPGGIDAHVHSRDPGFPEKEDFASLTAAAAAGGITTVADMPNTVPAVESAAVLLEKAELASGRALVDFALWGLLGARSTVEDVEGLLDAGAVGLKAYLGYAIRRVDRQVIYTPDLDDAGLEAPADYGAVARLAPDLVRRGAPLAAHCEDPSVLRAFRRPLRAYGDLLAARPALAEAVAIAALGVISQRTGLEVQIVHLSSALGLAAARDAGRAGARLVLETCPQYLWLADEDAARLGPAAKMLPPIRTAADRAALREALAAGRIARVATDHAPHADREKLGASLEEAPPGSSGVETLYLSCLELARGQGDVASAARWVAEEPARTLGLGPRKGAIRPGADADLVLVDPRGETVVRAEGMHSRQRHGAMEGQRFGFAVRAVYARGELVARDGRPVARPGRGRLVRPVRPVR